MISCPQCREELPEYALGHVSAELAAAMKLHLAACPVCRYELGALEAAWSALPAVLVPHAPSPELFDRIVAQIDGGSLSSSKLWRAASSRSAASGEVVARRPPPSGRERVLSYVMAASVLAGLTASYAWLASPSREEAAAIASVEELAERLGEIQRREADRLLRSERIRIVSLQPPSGLAGKAYLAWDLASRQWHFYVSDLSPAPTDRAYQLWAVAKDGTKLPGPTFEVDATGLGGAVADFPTLLPQAAAKVVVTLEPLEGSRQPSGKTVLEAAL